MKTRSLLATAVTTALLASSLVLTGCGSAEGSPDAAKVEAVISIPVEAALVSRGEISSLYRTTSTLEAKEDAEVNSKSTGIVQQLFVEEGDFVKAGQVMADTSKKSKRMEGDDRV